MQLPTQPEIKLNLRAMYLMDKLILRVLQLEGLVTEEDAPIDEAYITAEGRTVLIRDYAHDCFDDIDLDRSHALVIDGQTLYHWTDRVTGAGMGL